MTRASLALMCSFLVLGCPADDSDDNANTGAGTEGGSDTDTDTDGAPSFVAASFNAGLAFGYVAEASGRVDPVIAALQASEADLLCLQEVWTNQVEGSGWTTEVIDRVLSETSNAFPHQYWVRTMPDSDAEPTGCTVEESEPLEVCAEAACGDEAPENLGDCVLAECGAEFNALPAGCQSCLVSNLGKPLSEIVEACKGVTTDGIVYDGHNGLMVLSKHPLEVEEQLAFDYALTARSALHVRVTPPEATAVDVYCTHLASDLSSSLSYPETGTYTSFAEENAAQSQALLDWAQSTATAPTTVLLGDFNHGPGELPPNYQLMLDAGYADPVVDAGIACTFCGENTLLQGSGDVDDLIDHIYLQGAATVVSAELAFAEPVDIEKADGTTAQSNLSDHYGVEVAFTLPMP